MNNLQKIFNYQGESIKLILDSIHDDEKEVARENMIENEIDDAIEEKHQAHEEKLRGKAEEDSDEEVEGFNNVGWGKGGEL